MVTRFERVGRWSARHRWPVVLTWGVLILAAVPLALQTPGALRSGGFIRDDLESAQAKALLQTEIGVPEAALVIVLHSDTTKAGEPAFEVLAATALAQVLVGMIALTILAFTWFADRPATAARVQRITGVTCTTLR